MPSTAWLGLRHRGDDRALAFANGMQRLGYTVRDRLPAAAEIGAADALVIWNRFGPNAAAAAAFERAGRPVLVAENGYLGTQFRGETWYALAASQHNGAGHWPHDGGPQRWDALGVELLPWRRPEAAPKRLQDVVIIGQRGIGAPGVAMPRGWLQRVAHLGRVRPHPGRDAHRARPLQQDLAHARACITWGSGAALWALLWGIPVWHAMPGWIGAPAARPLADYEPGAEPLRDDAARLGMFRRLAWAMWRIGEIRSGEPMCMLGA